MSEKEGGGRTRGGGRGGRGMCCVLSHANPKVSLQGKRGVAQQRACSALSEGELDGVPGVPVDTSSASPMPATTTPATNGLRGLPPATPPGVPPPRPPGAPPEPTECSGGRESAGARRPSGSGAPALAPPGPGARRRAGCGRGQGRLRRRARLRGRRPGCSGPAHEGRALGGVCSTPLKPAPPLPGLPHFDRRGGADGERRRRPQARTLCAAPP